MGAHHGGGDRAGGGHKCEADAGQRLAESAGGHGVVDGALDLLRVVAGHPGRHRDALRRLLVQPAAEKEES